MTRGLAVLAFGAALSSTAAQSTSPNGFPTIVQSIVSGASETYALERCAALHFSILSYAGESRFSSDHVEASKTLISHLIAMSVLARVEASGADQNTVQASVQADVFRISQIYENRFADNYARVGQAFGSDELVNADLNFCKGIMDAMNE